MPTIIAICPYCRRGGVRAPDTAIGASANCPMCKSSFTLLPEDKLPDWAAKASADADSFKASSSPLAETRATKALPDKTEPSPVLPREVIPKSKKTRKAKQQPEPEVAVATPEPEAAPPDALATSLTT